MHRQHNWVRMEEADFQRDQLTESPDDKQTTERIAHYAAICPTCSLKINIDLLGNIQEGWDDATN